MPNGCESKQEDMRKRKEQFLFRTHDLLCLFVLEEGVEGTPLRLFYSFSGSVVVQRKESYERSNLDLALKVKEGSEESHQQDRPSKRSSSETLLLLSRVRVRNSPESSAMYSIQPLVQQRVQLQQEMHHFSSGTFVIPHRRQLSFVSGASGFFWLMLTEVMLTERLLFLEMAVSGGNRVQQKYLRTERVIFCCC